MQTSISVFQQAQMNKPREQVLDKIVQMYSPWKETFQTILLPYSSEFFKIESNEQLHQILGAWLYQIIQNSNNDEIKKRFQKYFVKPQIQSTELEKLSEEIFEVQKSNGLPSSDHFEKMGMDLKESFEYEKHKESSNSSYIRVINGEKTEFQYTMDISYRIAIIVSNHYGLFMVFSQLNSPLQQKQKQSAIFQSYPQQPPKNNSQFYDNCQEPRVINQQQPSCFQQQQQLNNNFRNPLINSQPMQPTNQVSKFQPTVLLDSQQFKVQQYKQQDKFKTSAPSFQNPQKCNIQTQQFNPIKPPIQPVPPAVDISFNPMQFQQNPFNQNPQLNNGAMNNQKKNSEDLDTQINQQNDFKIQRSNTYNFQSNIQPKPLSGLENNFQMYNTAYQVNGVPQINQTLYQLNQQQQPINSNPQFCRLMTPNLIKSVNSNPKQFQTNIQPPSQQQQQSPVRKQEQSNTTLPEYEEIENNFDFELLNQQSDIFSTCKLNEESSKINYQQSQNVSQLPISSYLCVSACRIECPICTDMYDPNRDAIIAPCCKKKVHKQCYIDDLISKANQLGRLDLITCFQCKECLKEEALFLNIHIPFELMLRLNEQLYLQNAPLKCFNCETFIEISQQMKDQQYEYQCTQCKSKICTLCRQAYHGKNQKNQQCPGIRAEILKAMAGRPITICPFCDLIQTKDDHCNHVTCSSCKSDLCSVCSVDRVPIIAHGNHYHRKGCIDYKPWIDEKTKKEITKEEKDFKNCQKCKENKTGCKYPISLDEYKKQKNY